MSKRSKKGSLVKRQSELVGYSTALVEVVELLEDARRVASRSVNTIMTAAYWEAGRRIVEIEQKGKGRADYGKQVIDQLSQDLTARLGRGFGRRNLFQMRAFYLAYSEIVQTSSAQLESAPSPDTIPRGSLKSLPRLSDIRLRQVFSLSWSHYVRLLAVKNPKAREFYEAEAVRNGWTIKQLNRQINSQFYERAALSRNKAAMLRRSESPLPEDAVTPEEEIKDPFVLEFLGLKDEYSESDLEEALIRQLENFLLELGGDFAFVGRQRRLRIGDQWFRVDLLFFYRGLHRLVIIDLLCGGQHNSSMTTRQRRPRWKNSRSTRNHWFPMRRCRCLPTKAKSPPSSSRKLSNFLIRASSK